MYIAKNMRNLRKIVVSFGFGVLIFANFLTTTAFAVDTGTVLPATDLTTDECKLVMSYVASHEVEVKRDVFSVDVAPVMSETHPGEIIRHTGVAYVPNISGSLDASDILACGIRTGSIRLWLVPYYIRYILEFVIGIAGLVAVGGIVYGGYLYLFAGVSDDKDKGKKAIMYGVVGMVLTLVAWAVVNIFVAFFAG